MITTVMTTEAVKLVSIMCQSLRDVLYTHKILTNFHPTKQGSTILT